MRHLAQFALFVAATGVFASAALAQEYGGHRYRDSYGNPYRGGGDAVDRVFADLQEAASTSVYARHQRSHFDHAMRELSRFQNKWRNGRFDKHPLDEAIGEMSHLSRAGELNPQVRDRMARDADELRAFRARGSYDGRYDGYSPPR
jgi:hypothetical protein